MSKFNLGQIVATIGAKEELTKEDMFKALDRFVNGDWGDVDPHDQQVNDEALEHGYRLMGVYKGSNGTKFWIITEADRSVTTILLPSEY